MKTFHDHVSDLCTDFRYLDDKSISSSIESACSIIVDCLLRHEPLLICGNGGSAADAMHISGELVGRFRAERGAMNVICLAANVSVLTAWANDYDYDSVFERQVEAHGRRGGVLLALSTSGNSKNIVRALAKARDIGIRTVGMAGKGGGLMAEYCDALISVPSTDTPRVQEMHVVVYHYLCGLIESRFEALMAGD